MYLATALRLTKAGSYGLWIQAIVPIHNRDILLLNKQ